MIVQRCNAEFRKTKSSADAAIAQLSDDELHVRINPLQNSIAVIMQHVAGNMISRWTDFLATDGEKPTRDREREFVEKHLPRAELAAYWERGWSTLFAALDLLTDADLDRTIHIRGEPHSVFQAINRQTAHYNLHLGQIMLIAKHLRGDTWKYLTIPPGGSAAFNEKMSNTWNNPQPII